MLYITGTPFSGLDLLADYFRRAGLVTTPQADPADFYIDPAVKNLNNLILKDNKLDPFNVPAATQIKFDNSHRYLASRFLKSNSGAPGAPIPRPANVDFLVDPRFCFTHPLWSKVSDADYLIVFRHPAETARDLHDNYGFKISESLEIWRSHYQRVVHLKAAFLELGADIETLDALDNFSRCASFLEIPDHQSKLETLLENHPFSPADIPVPAHVLALYRLLSNRSLE